MMGMDFSDSEDEQELKSDKTPNEETKKDAVGFQFGMTLNNKAKICKLGKSVQ